MPQKEMINAPISAPIFPKKKKSFLNKKIILRALVCVAFLLVAAAAVYFYLQTVQLKKTPADVAAAQLKDTVAKVSRLILLPPNETPTIASVSDPALLKTQSFFDKSQKGDQVLIYSTAKEAILYRPSTDMIINVAPVNTDAPANENADVPSAPTNTPPKK